MSKLKENEELYLHLMECWRDVEKDGYLYPTVYNIIDLATMHLIGFREEEEGETWKPFIIIDSNELYEYYQRYSRDRIWDVWVQFCNKLQTNNTTNRRVKSLPGYSRYCLFMDDLFDYLDELGYKDGDNITLKDAEKGLRILKVKLKGHIAGIDLENIYAED